MSKEDMAEDLISRGDYVATPMAHGEKRKSWADSSAVAELVRVSRLIGHDPPPRPARRGQQFAQDDGHGRHWPRDRPTPREGQRPRPRHDRLRWFRTPAPCPFAGTAPPHADRLLRPEE